MRCYENCFFIVDNINLCGIVDFDNNFLWFNSLKVEKVDILWSMEFGGLF